MARRKVASQPNEAAVGARIIQRGQREASAYRSAPIRNGNVVKTAKGRKFVSKPDEDMKPAKSIYWKGRKWYVDGRIAG